MLALVQDLHGNGIALHRTWLDPTTRDKAPVDQPRMLLSSPRGGAVRLHDRHNTLLIGEGTSEIQRMVIGKKILQRNKI